MPDLRTERTAAGGGFVLMLRFAATSILNYGFGVALVWLMPRSEFGAVSVLQNVLLLSAMVLGAGMPWVLARKIAQTDALATDATTNHAWDPTFRSAVAVNLGVATVLVGGLLIIQATPLRVLPDPSFAITAAVALTIVLLSVNAVLAGGLHGSRRFDALGIMQTSEIATKAVVGLAVVALLGLGAGGVAFGFLVGAVVATFCSWWGLRDRVPRWGPLADRGTSALAVPTGVGTGSFALLVTIDVLVLSAFGRGHGVSTAVIAVYQVAAILARIPYYLANALGDAVFPYIASGRTKEEGHAWFVAAVRWVVLGLLPIQLILLIVPGAPLRLLFPGGYEDATDLIRIMTVGTLALLAADLLLKALYARELTATVARRTPIAVAVQLAGLLVLVPLWGATGAAVAFALGCWTAVILLGAAYVRYHSPGRVRVRIAGAYLVAAGVLVAALVGARRLATPVDLGLIAAGSVAYVGLLVLFRLIRPSEVAQARAVLGRLVSSGGRQPQPPLPAPADQSGRPGAPRPVPAVPVRRRRHGNLLLIVGCLLVALVAVLWNIWGSPDSQYDEVVYTRAAQRIAEAWQLTWTNQPMFVHPPLSFLIQAGWLEAVGRGAAPLADAITSARLLAGTASVAAVLTLGALVYRLTSRADPRRRNMLVFAVVALAATDPILLRYGRLAIIEPFAVLGSVATLYLSLVLWHRPARWYVSVVGFATGLTLLTKELSLFLVVTPAIFALLGRDWRGLARAVGALLAGLALWLLFPLWAVQLGLTSEFFDVKFATLQRLLGFIQITGWNRPDVSFLSGIIGQAGQYASSYLLLAGGAIALLWLLLHRISESARWLLAWLIASYSFGAYTVLLGTLNEQFFVYVVPAALVGTVLVIDASVARRREAREARAVAAGRTSGTTYRSVRSVPRSARRSAAVAMLPVLALLAFAVSSWTRFYVPDNNALFRSAAYVRANLPACSAINVSGDPDKFIHLLPGYTMTYFGTGPGAVSHGVHLFFVSDKDAALRYGNASPGLVDWIRTHGTRLTRFPTSTYRGLELWRVGSDPYDPLADVEPARNGSFVVTDGSHCGGYRVVDDATGDFATGWADLGGKAVVGAPLTASYTSGGRTYQAFDGAVLVAGGNRAATTLPIVDSLAVAAPDAYKAAQLPPLTATSAARPPSDRKVRSMLTDPAIAAAYLGAGRSATPASLDRARSRFGNPLGPPVRMPDGHIRQPFAGVVIERSVDSADVRMAPVGKLAFDLGLLAATSGAGRPETPPSLDPGPGVRQPTTVKPFVVSLGVAAAVYVVLTAAVMVTRRRRGKTTEAFEVAA